MKNNPCFTLEELRYLQNGGIGLMLTLIGISDIYKEDMNIGSFDKNNICYFCDLEITKVVLQELNEEISLPLIYNEYR